jgi:2-C-methyl-D-erythritol 4-phosphate cytidylyltransferase / 2-C-methyl-D-erythritol 2,4-cyclodiphosphate synthase
MVLHTMAAFAAVPRIARVCVVVAADDSLAEKVMVEQLQRGQVLLHRGGGATRAATVLGGLRALASAGADTNAWVLVHDAARCLVTPSQINALLDACWSDPIGGILALPLPDTLKVGEQGRISATVSRADKWLAHTPQMFRLGALTQALETAGLAVTDEASAMEASGFSPKLVPSSAQNFKITYPEDFALAEAIVHTRQGKNMTARIGQGWDTHALVLGRKLIIGGVEIPFDKGLWGHSDADVLLHAVVDALLGAAALGDIGQHFPDTDAQFAGADSGALLMEVAKRVRAAGFEIGNIDSTIIAQAPKMAAHIPAMRAKMAQLLGLELAQVNVKAKTAEKLGPVGLGQSIEATAVALLYS